MNTSIDFEAWAEKHNYNLELSQFSIAQKYSFSDTHDAWNVWQAATSRQDAKVKALVEALEHALSWLEGDENPAWSVDAQNAIAAAKETT